MIELARRRMMMGGSAPLPTWLSKACEDYGLPVNNMVTIWQKFPEIQYVFEPNVEGKYLYLYSPNENARIDTGIKVSFPNDVIYCKGQIFKFGCNSNSTYYYMVSNKGGSYSLIIGATAWYGVTSQSPFPNSVTILNGNIMYSDANGIIYYTRNFNQNFTTDRNMYLFSWNGLKESISTMIQLFWFKSRGIFMLPYKNPTNNKYCMIDANSMNIYNNIGTVDFEIKYV